ncbi:MAG: hypothetical protein ACOYB0_08305 [Polynucleobacter sp.]
MNTPTNEQDALQGPRATHLGFVIIDHAYKYAYARSYSGGATHAPIGSNVFGDMCVNRWGAAPTVWKTREAAERNLRRIGSRNWSAVVPFAMSDDQCRDLIRERAEYGEALRALVRVVDSFELNRST